MFRRFHAVDQKTSGQDRKSCTILLFGVEVDVVSRQLVCLSIIVEVALVGFGITLLASGAVAGCTQIGA